MSENNVMLMKGAVGALVEVCALLGAILVSKGITGGGLQTTRDCGEEFALLKMAKNIRLHIRNVCSAAIRVKYATSLKSMSI